MVTVAAMVILIGAGIQVFMPLLKSFGFMAPVETTVTSFTWVIASTAIMPAVAAQQVLAGTGASMWLVLCVVISALVLGIITVVHIVSHRYQNVVHNMAKSAWATPDTKTHQVAAGIPFTQVVRPQTRIQRRPAGASMMLMLGLFFKSCGASTMTGPVVVASAHVDFLNLWFLSMVWLTVEAAFYLCCTRG